WVRAYASAELAEGSLDPRRGARGRLLVQNALAGRGGEHGNRALHLGSGLAVTGGDGRASLFDDGTHAAADRAVTSGASDALAVALGGGGVIGHADSSESYLDSLVDFLSLGRASGASGS